MISIYKLKPAFQKCLQPILQRLYKRNITANQLTCFAVLFSIGLGSLFLQHQKYPILLILFAIGLLIRMGLNALDGMMARQYNMQSKLGEVLNELGDVISDLVIIFPFVILTDINPLVIILFGVLSIINEFVGVLGKAMGGERRYEGPMGKSDRALLLGLFCIVFYYWNGIGQYANWIFSIACLLLIISTFARIKKSL